MYPNPHRESSINLLCTLKEHLGRNASNYFLYDERAQSAPPHPSELLHLNQAGVARQDGVLLMVVSHRRDNEVGLRCVWSNIKLTFIHYDKYSHSLYGEIPYL